MKLPSMPGGWFPAPGSKPSNRRNNQQQFWKEAILVPVNFDQCQGGKVGDFLEQPKSALNGTERRETNS
ncbi:MAG: hypothetical protein OEM83_01220 [Gammaproteobacteria bacterium]|nr:hypothetical protein [Gammaproteobacteria bacterium]MDH5512756.1 hypothetical protein [Gammaproteobacteria bacterium]